MKFHMESSSGIGNSYFINSETGDTEGVLTTRNKELARLIAAAPDLVNALQGAHRGFIGLAAYLETCSPEVIAENIPSLLTSLKRKRELAEAAIKKAEG